MGRVTLGPTRRKPYDLQFVDFFMTPTVALVELIEQLPADERQHIDEYIRFLSEEHRTGRSGELSFDRAYVEYLLAGIREGELAQKNGELLSTEEARVLLESLLQQ
jgi:hypothetical protein